MHPIATNARLAFGVYRLCLSGTHRLAFARALERWLQQQERDAAVDALFDVAPDPAEQLRQLYTCFLEQELSAACAVRWLQVSLFSPDPQLEVALSSATLAYYRQGLALALAEAAPAAPPGPSPEDSD